MKKFLFRACSILLIASSLLLISCSKAPNLYKNGIEITTTIGDMVNSDYYRQLMNISESINADTLKADDYNKPTKTYKITLPQKDILLLMYTNYNKTEWDELPDTVKSQIKKSVGFQILVANNNISMGEEYLKLYAVYKATKTFEGNLPSHVAYLYIFEKGNPIVVIFEPINDQIFQASGHFLFGDYDAFLTSLLDYESIGFKVNLMK